MIRVVAAILAVPLCALGATIGVWIGDRGQTTELISMNVPVPVKPGGQMEVRYEINRVKICDRIVRREIIDGEGSLFTLGVQSQPTLTRSGRYEFIQIVSVPAGARPGVGRYNVTIYDYCNPIHRWWPLVSTRSAEILIAQPAP